MTINRGFDTLPAMPGSVVSVGSYDGVHAGHRQMIGRLVEEARRRGVESVVLTFEPHPRVALGRAEGMRLLTSLDRKAALLAELGVDRLVVADFNRGFAAMSGREFVCRCLIGRLGARALVVGYNHRFGHDRADKSVAEREGLEVIEVGELTVDGRKVSSTVIRRLLDEGRTDEAEKLLGHEYKL